ncbi:MAG TPA: RNA polymerase sigma factor [Candidatus Acidoferrales bacterium]|nr:RNA polymerase sigma factor [Candidatus Acidoferrales bacterium]
MSDHPPESALQLPLTGGIEATRGVRPSPLVEEVVSLFDQLRDRLLRYVMGFRLPVQDGEDIVQEVFLALFRHLQQGRSRSNLRAWTFRVAHNQALKRRTRERIGAQELRDESHSVADLVPDTSPSPEDQAAAGQRRLRVLAAVNALPEQDRRCLVLRAEGLRYREIAAVLDISLGAVALSLERSLARLARAAQW